MVYLCSELKKNSNMIYKFAELAIVILFVVAIMVFTAVVAANIKMMVRVHKEARRDREEAVSTCQQYAQQKNELVKSLATEVEQAKRSADTLRREVNDFVAWRKEQGKVYAAGERPRE